jgi:elongation factor 2
LGEKIKPILIINKVDRGILELGHTAEQMYQQFQKVIEDVNVVISTYECDDMPESQQVDPTKGTVAFGSGYYGWAFTLTKFADLFAKKFKISRDVLMKKMWGNNYFDPQKKRWTTTGYTEDGKKLDRCFVKFIMDPINKLSKNINEEKLDQVWTMTEKLGIEMKQDEKQLRGKDLYRNIFKKWINAAEALLEMIIMKLPSPKQAQAYRAAQLYEGPVDDECCQAIKNCDKDGPLMVFISKMVPINDTGRFYAFGRVFSGTAKSGQKVRIMGPNYKKGEKGDLFVKNIQSLGVMMAGKAMAMSSVPCGNTVALVGIDKFLTKQGTISDSEEAHCIKAMKYSVSPVVRVSVSAKNATDLPKLIEGLSKLAKSDPLVQCWTEESGEHVIAGCGELHMEICLKDLEGFAKIPILKGEPVVAYRETVVDESSQICCSKSKNKLNRLYATAQPLGDELTKAIEDDIITSNMDAKLRSKTIVEEFKWDTNEAKKIWCFGPETTGPNLLVDGTSQA